MSRKPLTLLIGLLWMSGSHCLRAAEPLQPLPAPNPQQVGQWLDGSWYCTSGGSRFHFRFLGEHLEQFRCRTCGAQSERPGRYRVEPSANQDDLLFSGTYSVTQVDPQTTDPQTLAYLPAGSAQGLYAPKAVHLRAIANVGPPQLPRDVEQLIRILPKVFSGPRDNHRGDDAFLLYFDGGLVESGNPDHVRREPLNDRHPRLCHRAVTRP